MIGLLLCALQADSPQAIASADVVLPIARFEATTESDGDGGWKTVEVDGGEGGSSWERARATFELPDAFESGDWMLCLGGPGLEIEAALNGRTLVREDDGCGGQPWLAAGPRFVAPSVALRRGKNDVALHFGGAAKGRGFERGPALLLSREPAARLRASAAVRALSIPIANFASLATLADDPHLLDRVAFKFEDRGGEPALAAQLDCAVVDDERRSEIPMRQLVKRRVGGNFPSLSLQATDPRVPSLQAQMIASAPALTAPLRFSDAKLVLFEIGQYGAREGFQFVWHLRFFPARGGPLRVVKGKDFVLLRNDVVGLFAEDGRVLGTEEAPVGLAIVLTHTPKPGTHQAFTAAPVRCGVVGFERGAPDPSQAESMEDLVESSLSFGEDLRQAANTLGTTLANEPVEGGVAAGVPTRTSAIATLLGARRRGSRYLYAPAAGAPSAEAFWSDTFSLLHFPLHERGAIEWLLSTQEDDGSVRGDLPADASDPDLAAADAYAVLRACRWFRWTYDGDRFLAFVPKLARALDHADSVAARATTHVELARIAARRELVAALEQLGAQPELVASSQKSAEERLALLLRKPEEGGRWSDAGFVGDPGEDPREAAVALAFDLLDDARAATLAARLGKTIPSTAALDWRDALVVRVLLQRGRIAALGRGWQLLDQQMRKGALLPGSAEASYHGTLCFGLLGIRRDDLGTIEMRPQLASRQLLRTAVRIPEGALRVQVLAPTRQGERQLIVHNDSSLDLMAVIGVPSDAARGDPVRTGELLHTLHEQVIVHGTTWRATTR